MSEPFLGEMRVVSCSFAPKGWAFCDGQLLPISQNQALFALLGTTYGGDGRVNFALPDLRGRMPVHQGTDPSGNAYAIGTQGGETTVQLTVAQLPQHTHSLSASNVTTVVSPAAGFVGPAPNGTPFAAGTPDTALAPGVVGAAPGGGVAHDNAQPYLVLGLVIALQGIFPSRN